MFESFLSFSVGIEKLNFFSLLLFGTFIFVFLLQMFYYLFFYSRLIFYKKKHEQNSQSPVSIIICARNEEENLRNFLPTILSQDYPDYEIIVVNDCSTDNSQLLLKNFEAKYSNLYVTAIERDEKFPHGKKLALTIGIKASRHDWLLLTDADSYAISNKWLSFMQKNFTNDTEFVLGYGGYIAKKGLLNKLIRFDSFFIGLQYLTFAVAGVPYMGVGRNLAYRRKLFFENNGFASHIKLHSGDDDLFVNALATKTNTKIEISPLSHTCSEPEKTFGQWIRQKRRHFTTGKYYKFKHKVLLSGEILSRVLFYFLFFILLYFDILIKYIVLLFIIRFIIQSLIFYHTQKRLQEKDLFFFNTLFDIFMPIFAIVILVANIFNRKRLQWK